MFIKIISIVKKRTHRMNNKCDKNKLSQKNQYFGHNTFSKFTIRSSIRIGLMNTTFFFFYLNRINYNKWQREREHEKRRRLKQ